MKHLTFITPANIASGTVLTVGNVYYGAFGSEATRTMTFTGTTVEGKSIILYFDCTAEFLLRFPESSLGVKKWLSAADTVFGGGGTVSEKRAAMLGSGLDDERAEIAAYDTLIHTAAQPETLAFSLRLQGYVPASPTAKRSHAHVSRIYAAAF